ncbi:hypothetical protein EK904_010225 [Melospiza melodia maxima]|nr:hypothetical protein EK904_010225 [Melospiza melodia maxima]
MQCINSKDCKGPAFRNWIIDFQSKLPEVQGTLCHCSAIALRQILVNHRRERGGFVSSRRHDWIEVGIG